MSTDSIKTSVNDGVRLIKFNRPKKKNAWLLETYTQLIDILREDAANDSIVVTVLTGEGDYYSSGNDFSPKLSESDNYEDMVVSRVEVVKSFVKTLLDYPKLLIAVVNGPAIGFAVTTLALCDIVYASERATFSTPFINLGLVPEACSSYLFPRIMGRSKASEMLLLGEKLTAQEALRAGLVSEVVPHDQLNQLFQQRLPKYGKLPVGAIRNSKKLVVSSMKKVQYETNERECDMLVKCFKSDEFVEAITKFATRSRSKL